MAKHITVKEKMLDLIFHMLETGWEVNHEWLRNFEDEDVNFEKLMFGKVRDEAHLISKDKKYVAKFENKRLYIYQKLPKWRKLANFPIGQIKKTENEILYS